MHMAEYLNNGERIDDLMYKGLKIIQDPAAFCFGTDAVLLSSFIDVRRDDKIVDFCTGTGIIPMLLSGRDKAAIIKGLEIQPKIADMAKRSIRMNALQQTIEIIEGDIKDAYELVGGVYDVVTVNPPYEKAGSGETCKNTFERYARHEVLCTLDDIVRSAAKILKTGGRFYIIHRTSRFIELMETMIQYKLEPKKVRLIHPTQDKAPNYVLLEGKKNANKGLVFQKPLFVYDKNGEYTQELKEIYHLT